MVDRVIRWAKFRRLTLAYATAYTVIVSTWLLAERLF